MRFKVEWGEREKGLKKHSVDLESSYPKYMKGIGDKQLYVWEDCGGSWLQGRSRYWLEQATGGCREELKDIDFDDDWSSCLTFSLKDWCHSPECGPDLYLLWPMYNGPGFQPEQEKSLPNVLSVGCSDKKQTRCLQHKRERPYPGEQKSQVSRGSPSNTAKWDLTCSERSTFISQKGWQVPPTWNVLCKCCSDRTVSLPAGNVKYPSGQLTFPDFQYCPFQQMPIPSSI